MRKTLKILLHLILLISFLLVGQILHAQYKSLEFNGVDSYIHSLNRIGDEDANKTISFWVKNDLGKNTTGNIYTLYSYATKHDLDNAQFSGQNTLRFLRLKKLLFSINLDFKLEEWHHIAISNDIVKKERILYIDGELSLKNNILDYNKLGLYGLIIGAKMYTGNYSNFFKGMVRDVKVYNSILTEEDIKASFLKNSPESEEGLVLHWPLNEKDGSIAYDVINGNNGNIYNGNWTYDYPPYNGFIKLKEGLGKDTIGESGRGAIINITKTEVGFPNGLMMYQYGSADSTLVETGETFPTRFNARSNVFWHLSERGVITANVTFDYSQLRGIGNPKLVKILKRESISDTSWEIIEEIERDDDTKTITLKNITNFSQYTIGYTIDTNYLYLTSPLNNSINIDTTNINLSWTSDSSTYYRIFMGQNNPPTTLVTENLTKNTFLVDSLRPNTKYYWRVIGYDKSNEIHSSSTWSFTTIKKENYFENYSPALSQLKIHYNDVNSEYLITKFTVAPDRISNQLVGNTGLTYDKNTHKLWIARFNFSTSDYVIVRDRNNQLIKSFNVQPYVTYIQGLALNSKDSSFWVAGVRPNWTEESGLSKKIITHFDKDGQFLDNIPMANASFGMMKYVENKNALWIKENERSLARLISLNTLDTLQTIDLGMRGEGIGISPFDSTFWLHNGTSIAQVSKYGQTINTFPSPVLLPPNAEDITVDPSDYTIWVGADEYLHGGINGGNRVWHLDPLQTYNKDVFFPNMIHWREGILGENLEMKRDTIYVKLGEKKAYWTSPVINFKEYQPETPTTLNSNEEYSYFTYRYRGSNSEPSTELNNQHVLDYYSASNSISEGWGSVVPSNWSDTIPDFQYIQVSIELSLFNFPPTAIADTFSVIEENPLLISTSQLLKNDFDFDNYPIKDFLVFGDFAQAKNGTVSISPAGNLTYQPNENFFGEDFFTYTIYDSRDSSNSEKVIINVLNVNDSPQIISQNPVHIYEDQLSSFDLNTLIVNDSDNNFPEDFTFQLFGGENYQIIDNKILPNENYNGTIWVNILINDGNSEDNLSNIFSVQISVLAINDNPIITGQKTITSYEDETFNLKLEDILVTDVDNNFPTNFLLISLENENYSVTNNAITPNQDFFGELIVPVQINDGEIEHSESTIFNLKINILPVNDKTIISSQETINIFEDEVYQLSLNDIFYSDVDNAEHILHLNEAPNYTILEDNKIQPEKDFNGILYIPVIINDNELENNLSSEFVIEINVFAVNDSPVISLPNITFNEDETSDTFNFSNYIGDIDNSITDLTLLYEENNNIEIIRDNFYFYFRSKNKDWYGSEKIAFTLSDGEFIEHDTILVTCSAVNDTPIISAENSINWIINEPYTFSFEELSVIDVDNFGSAEFTLSLLNGANYSITENTIIPDNNYSGTIKVPISITDNGGLESNTSYIYISYFTQENAPSIDITQDFSYIEDQFVKFDITPYISDNSMPIVDLKIEWQTNSFFSITEKDKIITIESAEKDWNGSGKIIFYVNNGIIKMPDTIYVTCSPVNDAPFFNEISSIEFKEDEQINISLSAIFGDVDTDFNNLTYQFSGNNEIKLEVTNSTLEITNQQINWNGIENINISVSDGQYEVNKELIISCLPVNDSPNLNLPNFIQYDEDTNYKLDFSVFFNDVDNPNSELIFTWNNNTNINIVWDTNFTANIFSNSPNWSGSEEVIFQLSDGENTKLDTILIYCNAINDAPYFTLSSSIEFNEDEKLSLQISEIAKDVDNTDDELILDIANNNNIYFQYQENKLSFYSKDANWNGSELVLITISDGLSSIEQELSITIHPINDSPYFTQAPKINFNEDEEIQFNLESVVFDIDNNFSELTYIIDSISEPISINQEHNILTVKSNQENWNGSASFYVTVSDHDLSIYQRIDVICLPVNDSPIINTPDTIRFFEDNTLSIDFSVYISDVDNKKSSFSLSWNTIENINIREQNLDLAFSNNLENWSGEEDLEFTVSDNSGGTSTKRSKIIVIPINDAPVSEYYFPTNDSLNIYVDSTFEFNTVISDIDSEINYNWYINNKKIENTEKSLINLFDSLGIFNVKAIAFDKEYQLVKNWIVNVKNRVKEVENTSEIILYQNRPNPFSRETKIEFYLPEETNITLVVYNLSGSTIKTLIKNRSLKEGLHSVVWDGYKEGLNKARPGIYLYKLTSSKQIIIKKAVLLNN